MANLKISRRTFMGSLAASAAVLPLSNYPWAHPLKAAPLSEKKIDWGYPEGAVRLNANENPYGPSPNAIKAMEKGLSEGHRYTRATQLTKELASYHGVSTDMVLAGCGSTEFLRIAPWAFLRHGGELVTALQTFKTLPRESKKIAASVNEIPLDKNFYFDLQALKKALTPKTKMVYLVNPNNPTGTRHNFEDIQSFCASLPKSMSMDWQGCAWVMPSPIQQSSKNSGHSASGTWGLTRQSLPGGLPHLKMKNTSRSTRSLSRTAKNISTVSLIP